MSNFKEFLESIENRVKSPVLGSIFLAFIFLNWKALFHLFFSKGPTSFEKFEYFDANTDCLSLILFPIILGALIAIVTPYINYFAAKMVEWPIRHHKVMQAQTASKIIEEKEHLKRIREQVLIERAQIDVAVDSIENEEVRENLKQDIEQIRSSNGGISKVSVFGNSFNPNASNKNLQEIYERLSQQYENDHNVVLQVRRLMAENYAKMGKHEEAIEILEQVIAKQMKNKKIGPLAPDTLLSKTLLAIEKSELGLHSEAVRLFEQVLSDQTSILGPEHPETTRTQLLLELEQRRLND